VELEVLPGAGVPAPVAGGRPDPPQQHFHFGERGALNRARVPVPPPLVDGLTFEVEVRRRIDRLRWCYATIVPIAYTIYGVPSSHGSTSLCAQR
jgi:hypothetical protein